MGITINSSGTATITGTGAITTTVSQTIVNVSGTAITGVYQLMVDANAIGNGSEGWIEISQKVSGTLRVTTTGSFSHALSEPNIATIPLPADSQYKAVVKMSAGNKGKTFPYKLYKLDGA